MKDNEFNSVAISPLWHALPRHGRYLGTRCKDGQEIIVLSDGLLDHVANLLTVFVGMQDTPVTSQIYILWFLYIHLNTVRKDSSCIQN